MSGHSLKKLFSDIADVVLIAAAVAISTGVVDHFKRQNEFESSSRHAAALAYSGIKEACNAAYRNEPESAVKQLQIGVCRQRGVEALNAAKIG